MNIGSQPRCRACRSKLPAGGLASHLCFQEPLECLLINRPSGRVLLCGRGLTG